MRPGSLRRQPAAFTLIELLVVIAIIAILIALLVPAVQKVRASAANSQCQNNLKQMALACHMYQDQKKTLPPGWVTSFKAQPSSGWSWSLVILPYIEQGALYNAINPDVVTPNGPPNTPAAGNTAIITPIPIFFCPSDNTSQKTNPNFNNYGMINYVCNRWVLGPDGINSQPAAFTVQGITDGASNTLLLGERDITWNVAGSAFIRHSNSSSSFEGRAGKGLSPMPNPTNVPWTTGANQRLAYSSQHTNNSCNFAFADGSVRQLPTSVPADPNDDWTNFPPTALGAGWQNYTLQLLEVPNDMNPVTLNF